MSAAVIGVFLLAARAMGAQGLTPKPDYGVLLMAHGGNEAWNREVLKLRSDLDEKEPVEVAFGMADSSEMQGAVDRLEQRGAGKIVAVPLFVNSASEVLDQTRYLLGLREKPSEVLIAAMARLGAHARGSAGHDHHHAISLTRVKADVPLAMTRALDAHPLVAEVLLGRAKDLSRDPKRETVILVGHGPVDDRANGIWLATMRSLAKTVREKGRFKRALAATIRDDSPDEVKARAAEALRAMVIEAGRDGGRAIVVPYLIARGGIEDHIVKILDGLAYAWDARTICPHPNIERWIAEVAARGARERDMRRYR